MGNEIKRVLAEIAKIEDLSPIEGADKIEVASIRGWKIVVQKGLHKINDLVVYFSIDALLPIREEFEFLRKGSYVANSVEGEGFRLKTIKMRGQVSQGLIVPIRDLKEFQFLSVGGHIDDEDCGFDLPEGHDVTETLGVKKYEKIYIDGVARGSFPHFIHKTDQERIQNFFKTFQKKYSDHDWEVSLKLDGSSMTVYYKADEDRFGVASRNIDLEETEGNPFWNMARKLDLENKMRSYSYDYCLVHGTSLSFAIQGELMGPGIQGNRENLTENRFFVYDVFDIADQTYFNSSDRTLITDAMSLDHVPVYLIEQFDFATADGFLDCAELYREGKSLNNPIREGLVFKSVNDPNVSFKAISNKFLLKGGE